MRAEQQVTEANKLMPKVHEARSIKGYETVQSVNCLYRYFVN